MSRPRDTQRSKVYAAERSIDAWVDGKQGTLMSIGEVEQFVCSTMGMAWYKRDFVQKQWHLRFPIIRDGRGHRRATGGANTLTFPRWSRYPLVICHEMAHMVARRLIPRDVAAAHGPEFCAVYLHLVAHAIDPLVAQDLRAAFRDRGVRFTAPTLDLCHPQFPCRYCKIKEAA